MGAVTKDYLAISWAGTSESGKTSIWEVKNDGGEYLGKVMWHGPWRKYVFAPGPAALFDNKCMEQIIEFCVESTGAHYADLKAKRERGD